MTRMSLFSRITLPLLITVFSLAPLPAAMAQEEKKPITLQDAFMNPDFRPPRMINMQWMKDGLHYAHIKATDGMRSIWKVNAESGEETLLVDGATIKPEGADEAVPFSSYAWSAHPRYLVITLSERSIWRRSTIGTYAVYDLEHEKLISLPEHPEGVMNVKVSPDGRKVGYVFEDNIHVMDIETREETQLTFDARKDVHNGRFGWVYEEEFSIVDGWLWSPDSKRIAFWQEDERQVRTFTMTNFIPLYHDYIDIRYPKAGEKNPIERIGVIELDNGEIQWMDIGEEADIYIPRMFWTRDPHTLCIYRMNRLQNELEFLFADVRTGESRIAMQEQSSTGWIEVDRTSWLHFLESRDQFIWTSERDGFNHLYLYDYNGNVVRQITTGNFEVVEVLGITPDEKTLYYLSTEDSPLERHLYRIGIDGKSKQRLTRERGYHSIDLSPTCALYIDTWSSSSHPMQRRLFDVEGKELRAYESMDAATFDAYHWSEKEFFTVTTSDGWTIDCSMLKPANFDPARRYPVFFDVYGGPATQAVRNTWPSALQQWYSNEGFIVIQADNRGSGARGTKFKHAVYRQLGKWEVHDYIEVAKYLGTLPWVNSERIGIWGWSYGGYLAALSMLLGADYFHSAVSIAPVTDWKLYDTIYAERYMQRPEDNPAGFDVGSCLVHADKLKGNLLLVHGGLDDNVHLQNTMKFIDVLIEEGKQFDMRIYPNGNHGVAGGMKSRFGLFQYYMDFMKRHLIDG